VTTYTDPQGVVHVVTKRYPAWTACNKRMEGSLEQGSGKFPTCFWCVINKLWRPW
jgi:hypothetical protein